MIQKIIANMPMPIGKAEGKFWKGLETFHICILVDGLWENFRFEKGFLTDLGSVPERLQGIVNPGTCSEVALALYLCHDCGYATHERSRDWYDKLLYNGLDETHPEGFDSWDWWLVKCAIRLFGGKPWKDRSNSNGYKHETMQPKPAYGNLNVIYEAK